MADVINDRMALFVMPNGKINGVGSDLQPLALSRHSLTGRTRNSTPGVSQEYATDEFGRIFVRRTFKDVPGGLDQFSLVVKKVVEESYLEKMEEAQKTFPVWRAFNPCVSRDNPQGWLQGGQLEYFGHNRVISGATETDGPMNDGTSGHVTSTTPVVNQTYLKFLPLTITSLTPSTAENVTQLNGIFVLQDPIPENCVSAYRGPGKHIIVVQNADTGVAAELFISSNGGGSWAVATTNPFGADEHIGHIVGGITTGNKFRIAVGRADTDAGAPAEIAYTDITFGDELTTSFTNVNVGSANGEFITMMAQLFSLRAYYGTNTGSIFVSTDQHESNTEIYNGSTQINVAIKGVGECDDVWFGGATNTLLVERSRSGNVAARVGPSGGGAFTALAMASDGTLFAGNGTSLYVSLNQGENAGGWFSVKDFGVGRTVQEIFLPKGDPYNIYVVVDATIGEFWHSNDGGNSWNQVLASANTGYNAGVASIESPNEFWLVGDANATPLGVVEKLVGVSGGCG